jgi:signal peptidase II
MEQKQSKYWPLNLLFIFALVLFDQISKWWAIEKVLMLGKGGGFFVWISSIPETVGFSSKEILPNLNIVMVWNYGISFGLFNNQTYSFFPLLITIITASIIIIFIVWMFKTDSRALSAGLCMVIGGAFGNLIDRLRFNAVIDFVDIHFMEWHWPAFNLADTCIVLGIAFVVFDSLFLEPKRNNRTTDVQDQN